MWLPFAILFAAMSALEPLCATPDKPAVPANVKGWRKNMEVEEYMSADLAAPDEISGKGF